MRSRSRSRSRSPGRTRRSRSRSPARTPRRSSSRTTDVRKEKLKEALEVRLTPVVRTLILLGQNKHTLALCLSFSLHALSDTELKTLNEF